MARAKERGVRFIVDTMTRPLGGSAKPAKALQKPSGSGTCSITSDATTASNFAPGRYVQMLNSGRVLVMDKDNSILLATPNLAATAQMGEYHQDFIMRQPDRAGMDGTLLQPI